MAVILLDSTSTSFQAPFDWSNTNTMHIIGGGAGGVTGGGGGGGGYSKFTNITTYTVGTSYPVNIAAASAGTTTYYGNSADITYVDDGNYSTISYVAGSKTQNTATGPITINTPTGTANGDLLIAVIQTSGLGSSSDPMGVNAGWTLLPSGLPVTSPYQVWYKYAQSEPATQNFLQPLAGFEYGSISCFRGAIIDVNSANASGTTTITLPSVTASKSNSYSVLILGQTTGTGGSYTTPTGYTAGQSNYDATAPAGAVFYKSGIAAGATGTVAVTSGVTPAGTSNGLHLILRPKPLKFAQGGGSAFSSFASPVTGKGGYGLTFSGGSGGTVAAGPGSTYYLAGSGGGGAAGVNGAGLAGATGSTTTSIGGDGGNGDNSTGGAGGAGSSSDGAVGGDGTEIASPYGSGGGGGGGGTSSTTGIGGDGGSYGGGGGGGGYYFNQARLSGTGAQGAIIISYTGATIVQANKFFEMF